MADYFDTITAALEVLGLAQFLGLRLRPAMRWLASVALAYSSESITQMAAGARGER